ncbi:MAG TPA: hypothetical protein VMS22_00740 [Candidatus Eisenbacteria bacterium]|nr:hypothetical protein [Candidatus Eisenbacteria bacterium]
MGAFDNLREFMDRLNFLALKNFYRTKAALDDIEAGTFSTAQTWLNPLLVADDIIALWLPTASTAFATPQTIVIPGSKLIGTAAKSVNLGLAAGATAKATALQPIGMPVGTAAVKATDVQPVVAAPSLNVSINNLGNYAVGNYRGIVFDGSWRGLALVELQLGP